MAQRDDPRRGGMRAADRDGGQMGVDTQPRKMETLNSLMGGDGDSEDALAEDVEDGDRMSDPES